MDAIYKVLSNMAQINHVEKILHLNDPKIKRLYDSWDKGDCSLIGIVEILLYQSIHEHIKENGEYYNHDIDQIKLRIK